MQSRLERSKNLAAVANFQRRLEYDCGPLNLLGNERRRLLFSGPVGSKKLHLFLLSDMVILAKGPYPPNDSFKASGPRIDLTDKAFSMKVDAGDRALHLGAKVVHFKNKEDLRAWHSRISEALLEILACSVFGTPLGAGRNGKAVPPLVEQCIRYLSAPDVMATKGLFRLSGTKSNVDRLRAAFDKGIDPRLTDPSITAHDVATLLKQFFRELPISLIPQPFFHPLVALGNQLEDGVTPELLSTLSTSLALCSPSSPLASSTSPRNASPALLTSANSPSSSSSSSSPSSSPLNASSASPPVPHTSLTSAHTPYAASASIPPAHIHTLQYLLEYLLALSSFSPVNMMTPHNIAIVFTPNILKAPVENMDATLAQPTANLVIETLMEHYHQVFGPQPVSDLQFPLYSPPSS